MHWFDFSGMRPLKNGTIFDDLTLFLLDQGHSRRRSVRRALWENGHRHTLHYPTSIFDVTNSQNAGDYGFPSTLFQEPVKNNFHYSEMIAFIMKQITFNLLFAVTMERR